MGLTTTINLSSWPELQLSRKECLIGSLSMLPPGKNFLEEITTLFVSSTACMTWATAVGAASHVRRAIKNDGSWMIVEPFAKDDLQDNLNPVGRVYYSFSTLLCTPCSRSQEVGMCLGAQAGEKRIREVVNSAGFTRFRRATETPFNLVYEAKP